MILFDVLEAFSVITSEHKVCGHKHLHQTTDLIRVREKETLRWGNKII